MAEYIKNPNTGKFAGSIGDGKTRIPTAADQRAARLNKTAARTSQNFRNTMSAIGAHYGIHLDHIVDDGPAQSHDSARVWHGPITINGARFHVRHNPDGTGPALYRTAFFGKPLTRDQLDKALAAKTGKSIDDLHASHDVIRGLIPAPEGSRWEIRPHYMTVSGNNVMVYEVLELVVTENGERTVLDSGVHASWGEPSPTGMRAGEFGMIAMGLVERHGLGIKSRSRR